MGEAAEALDRDAFDLLVAEEQATVQDDRTGETVTAYPDDNGILRNGDGECFSAGAYSIVEDGGDDGE
jgi:hypothetical protein